MHVQDLHYSSVNVLPDGRRWLGSKFWTLMEHLVVSWGVIWGNKAVSTADLTWIITSPFITEPCFGSGDGGFSIAGNWDCWLSESKFRTLVKHWVVVHYDLNAYCVLEITWNPHILLDFLAVMSTTWMWQFICLYFSFLQLFVFRLFTKLSF